jgi:ABC-type multidrug transport system fused ATPase/permease subunit
VSRVLRRFLSLTARNLRLINRNWYLVIIVVLALLYAAATRFLIPADLSQEPVLVVWDTTAGQAMRQLYAGTGGGQAIIVESESDYAKQLEAAGRIGLKVVGAAVPERIEVTYQGWETEPTRRLLEASLQGQVAMVTGTIGTSFPVFQRVTLRETQAGIQPPFNLSLVPIFVFSEAVLMGIFLAGALLIAEREDRTNLAYQVSPAGPVEYLMASCVAMGLLGLVFTVILNLLTTGLAGNWPVILLLVFLGAVVTTVITLAYAALFNNLSQFLAGSILAIFILSVPAASYFMPSFSPLVVRLLPSYPLIFALREAYFPSGNPGVTAAALWQLAITLVVLAPFVIWALHRHLRGGEA